MGAALAMAALAAGHPVSVWNRNVDRAIRFQELGARVAGTAGEAVERADVVVVCFFDHRSVHDALDPVAERLRGRAVVNLTTTSPESARELAEWATANGAHYLDGGVMAVPEMIGGSGSQVLYSGSRQVFDDHRALLGVWGGAEYLGAEPGLASLIDLALLSSMYLMFAGFFHGVAMVGTAGVSAADYAARATPWVQAMAESFAEYASVIDGGDYAVPGQQSLEFSDLGDIIAATREQGIGTDLVDAVQRLIRRQVAAGHGAHGFARVVESLRQPA